MNLPITLDASNSKHTVWDNEVPIVTEKNITRVYLNSDIHEPAEYNELCYKLSSASSAETFFIYLNTPGGMLDAAIMIVNALASSQATTVAVLSGTVASAGTIIALSCDEVLANQHLSFMIHNYSGGLVGKGHEMRAHQQFNDRELTSTFKTFYKGFLTETEIQEVIDGQDYWLNADEVTERWARKTENVGADYGTDEV